MTDPIRLTSSARGPILSRVEAVALLGVGAWFAGVLGLIFATRF